MTEYYIKTEQDKLTNSVNFKCDHRIHVQHIKKLNVIMLCRVTYK